MGLFCYCFSLLAGVLQKYHLILVETNMPSFEQSNESPSDGGDVHAIEFARKEPGSYQEFYDQYGSPEYVSQNGRRSAGLLLNRVLRMQDSGDQATHLIVHEMEDAFGVIHVRRRGDDGTPEQVLAYGAEDFLVVSFNGLVTQRLGVRLARGIHRGSFYGPSSQDEAMHLSLATDDSDIWGKQRLEFNRATGDGKLMFAPGQIGHITSSDESAMERFRVLHLSSPSTLADVS
jgi:hypothetical protein